MPCLLEDTKYSAEKRRGDKVPLGFDDLGGVLLRVYNSNDHDRISLLNHSPGGRRSFLAAERTLDLSIHPQEEPFLCGSCLCLWLACVIPNWSR